MGYSFRFVTILIIAMFVFLCPSPAFSQFQYKLTPGISVSESYTDNINLSPTNEISDYITGLTPNIAFDILKERTDFRLYYAPTFVFYRDNDQNNTTRHLATLTWGQALSRYLRFDLADTYYQSEQPIEYSDTVLGVRTRRQTYRRNLGDATVSLLFGPENALTFGYNVNHLKNEDPTIDDGRIQKPNASLSYWFNVKNGLELNYLYTKGEFWNDVVQPRDDYTGNDGGIRFTHRFTPHTSAFVGYNLMTRDFDLLPADFDINEGSLGFDHAFSPNISFSLAGGYFIVDFKHFDDDKTGPTYNALLTTRFEQGNFTIGGTGGWWFYGDYIDPQNRGLTQYYSGNARIEYQLAERFGIYAGGYYRLDRDIITNREWDIWRGDAGIRWSFLEYFSLTLDYRYADRNDDVDTEDFKNNRIMLLFTASKLYRW
jgi:hypothetical protein